MNSIRWNIRDRATGVRVYVAQPDQIQASKHTTTSDPKQTAALKSAIKAFSTLGMRGNALDGVA